MGAFIKQQRDCKFELIRIFAIIGVIGAHCLEVFQPDGTVLRQFFIYLFSTIFFLCNALFFMISGKFALQKSLNDNQYGDFYFKKVVYLLLPLLIYMVIYSLTNLYRTTGSFSGFLKKTMVDVFCGYGTGIFWFMYPLFGYILISPFLARSIEGLSKKAALILVSIGFCYNTIYAYTPYFLGVSFSWSSPLSQWCEFFILGGCIDKIITNAREKKLVVILGMGGFVIIMLKNFFFSYKLFMNDLMPSYFLLAVMVYVLFLQIEIKSEKIRNCVLFLGRRTYGVYLIHFVFIGHIYPYIDFMNAYITGIPYLLYVITVVFLASLVSSYVFELIFINHIQRFIVFCRNTFFSKKC